ncbi:cytochrome c biogenesis protein [Pelotalea chapellei]|uniref:Cytochrome c biogenesis protein CcsA n=1 Tax=Pelotalea chapellei TaxID=44671 RepID=A0ABS5U3I7_9BACT|nr:cytochrome c biogenesis protein CcsA [Pelotalea chapellei]MBT1070209.1 cytochrome c biogenesis protein CcsA [Pelotalea chapellei]
MKSLLLIFTALSFFGAFNRGVLAVGTAVGVVYLGLRGWSMGRLPLIGPHDTVAFFAVSLGVMGLAISLSPSLRRAGWFNAGAGIMAGLFGGLALIFPARDMPMPAILDTLWFELHVVLAFFAYALFGIGALVSGGWLATRDRSLMDIQFKAALAGWSFFSASMISGGIWGYYAWGTYWLWTPKELWTSILWLFYALLLHLRLKGAKWEVASAWSAIFGFAVTLFTYLGVSLLMKSSHSF